MGWRRRESNASAHLCTAAMGPCYARRRPSARCDASQHSPRVITLSARPASVTVSSSRWTEAREWALLGGVPARRPGWCTQSGPLE